MNGTGAGSGSGEEEHGNEGEEDDQDEEDVSEDDGDLESEDEDQENVDPVVGSSVTTGPSRRRLRNGKSVLRAHNRTSGLVRSRRPKRPQAPSGPGYSPRKRKRDDPEYTDDDEEGVVSDEFTDDEAVDSGDGPVEAGIDEVDDDIDDSAEPDYIDESE